MSNKNDQQYEESTVQRCPHDSNNPYTMVHNDLIRDQSISPNCRWLIIYLLSNDKSWVIKTSEIANHVKEFIGRDAVYTIMDEAIAAGYLKREQVTVNNLKRYILNLKRPRN